MSARQGLGGVAFGFNELRGTKDLAFGYLTTALSPDRGTSLGVRSERELRTLATALDGLLQGRIAQVADLLRQRFRAVEASGVQGWSAAANLELIPGGRVSSLSVGVQGAMVRKEALKKKLSDAKSRFVGTARGRGLAGGGKG